MMKKALALLFTFVFLATGVFTSFAATETILIDFNNEDADANAKDIIDIIDLYEVSYGTPTSFATVVENGENKYLNMKGYVAFASWEMQDAPYEFSMDVQIVDPGLIGFFVRSVYPVTKWNPANGGGTDTTFVFFEADWYQENQGKNGSTGIGGSGICVIPKADGIRVNLKTYEPDGLKIANKFYDFPLPEGLNISEFFNLKFKDDGEKVEILINDQLLATVEMSEPGVYEEDEDDPNEYLKKAVVKDAAGNEVLSINNARISAGQSQVGIGNRNKEVNIDNLKLTYEAPDPTPTPEATPEPEETKTPTQTQTSPSPSSTSSSEDKTEGSSNIGVIIGIIVAVVVVSVIVVIVLVSKKKK